MIRFAAVSVAAALALSVTVVSLPATAQVSKQGNKYLFRMKFNPGQTIRYVYTSEAKSPMGAMKASVTTTMRVKNVKGKTASVEIQPGQMTMNGKPVNQQQKPILMKLDDRGRPVGGQAGAQVAAQLPDKPLAIGETFTTDTTVGVMGRQFKVKAQNKFIGLKKEGARSVAVIQTTTTGSGALQSTGFGTTTLDVADGSLVSMSMKQTMTITQGQQSQSVDNVVTMTRK